MDERPDWHEYFINIAEEVAQRSTCPRAKVGAVIVKDHRIISTGYNGAPAGEPHCSDEGCIVHHNHCVRAVHAEVNAVCEAAKYGVALEGSVLYYWDSMERSMSCQHCMKVMKSAGVVLVIDRFHTVTDLRYIEVGIMVEKDYP